MRKMKKLFVILGASVVVAFIGQHNTSLAATVTPSKVGNEFEDSDTEAVVIDAVDDYQGLQDEEKKRNGKQYLSYFPLLTDSLWLPEVPEKGNEMGAISTAALDSSCITNQGRKGNCLKFEECFPLLNLPEDKFGNGTKYSNLLEELYQITADRKCSSIVHTGKSKFSNICCDLPQREKTEKVEFYNNPPSVDELMTNSSVVQKYSKVVNTWATCGEKQFDMKIIGGQEAIPHEYPWMVSLWGKSGKHICGASLLDNNFVITAAHCIARYTAQDIGKIKLHIGDHDIHSTSDGHHEIRSVTRIIKHKRFSLQTFVNDIALLRMDRPVPYTDRIRPICLPTGTTRIDNDEHLVVAGWGQTAYKGTSSSVLRKVTVPGVSNDKCGTVYNSISPVGITTDMICAGGIGVDSCIGDSGGPLIQLSNNRYEQVGIVSFGRECGYYPGVYTKVHSFLNWIHVNRNKY